MKRTGIRRTGTVFMTAFITLVLSMQTVFTALAAEHRPSLRLEAKSGSPVGGVEFSLYRVADMPKNGEYTVTDAFKGSRLDIASLNGSSTEEMQAAANEIVRFVGEENIKADYIMVTNENGIATQEEIEKGMYLVNLTGTPGTDLIVESRPFFLSLPMMKKGSGDGGSGNISWFDIVTASPKIVTSTKPGESETDESKPGETETDESKPGETDESTSDESKPGEDETDESKNESKPDESGTDESTSDESSPNESSTEASKPQESTSGNTGGGGGGGGRDHDRGTSGGQTTTILDPEVPLASFPTSPDEPELVELEDDPVPLAALPKLGDVGMAGCMAGLMLSLAAAATVLVVRRKLGGSEEK